MSIIIAGSTELSYDNISVIPLGGQNQIGQVLWAISCAGQILLIDAGAAYAGTDLPGVDLLLPNTNFLEINQDKILALILTNGHEEHCGAVSYLLRHVKIPRIMAPRFVSALISQTLMGHDGNTSDTIIDTIEVRESYQIGPFELEWIQVNDAIADACALRINTSYGPIIYTSSFKLDQTPIDNRQMDIARLAQIGDTGVLLLLSDSAGVEQRGYTPSERTISATLYHHVKTSSDRVIVVMEGTNTHRLQLLFDLAKTCGRKIILLGENLIQTAVSAAITSNLIYDRSVEGTPHDLKKLSAQEVLIVGTGDDGDALGFLNDIAYGLHKDISILRGDTVIFSSEIYPGRSRKLAKILDQLLSLGVKTINGAKDSVHVPNHASQEELKLMLSITKPKFFVPFLGEGRHIMHHAKLACDFGIAEDSVFPLKNGEILEIAASSARVIGSVEAEAVLFNRDQAESVTTFSVHERRVLSMEGVLNIGIVISNDFTLLQKPTIEGSALGFIKSEDWLKIKEELLVTIEEMVANQKENMSKNSLEDLKASIREVVVKAIRQKLQAKPAVQIVIHEPFTSHHE
jgi:ribonuclease J